MSIATEITRIKGAKEAMKSSIRNKGVAVDDAATLDTYASKVNEIASASGIGNLDLSGTGWETEPTFPVNIARIDTLQQDLDYTRTKFSEWEAEPDKTNAQLLYRNDAELIYAPKIDTSRVKDMRGCFFGCKNLISIPQLDTAQATDMTGCFRDCTNLTSIPFLNTSKVGNIETCFADCSNLISIPQLDTSAVTNMRYCFNACIKLTSVPKLNTSLITNMYGCFYACTSLTQVELAGGMLPECNCTGAFNNVALNGVLKIHTGGSITRSSYDPVIKVLPSTWTVEEINDL